MTTDFFEIWAPQHSTPRVFFRWEMNSFKDLFYLLKQQAGTYDDSRRRIWWFLFQPDNRVHYFREIWCFKRERIRLNKDRRNALCFLDYVEGIVSTFHIAVFQFGSYFIGYIQYQEAVTRLKASFDLKIKTWCIHGLPMHSYPDALRIVEDQNRVVTPERQISIDAGNLSDIFLFIFSYWTDRDGLTLFDEDFCVSFENKFRSRFKTKQFH